MARRRFQRTGILQRDGNWWRLRFWEDVSDGEGGTFRRRGSDTVGPCRGPDAITEKEAKRRAADRLKEVNRLDVIPGSLMLVRDFIERRFKPEYVPSLKRGGQDHYAVELKHVVAALGEMPLREVKHQHVQRMCLDLLEKTYTVGKDRIRKIKDSRTGEEKLVTKSRSRQVHYSVQTALHLKNATSVFKYAKAVNLYSGENPAANVRLPEMSRKAKHALTVEQMKLLLEALPSPAREMAHLAVLTSMNVAEMCGLRWQAVNLTDSWPILDGEVLPPKSTVIRLQWSTRKGGGAYHTVKARGRGRFLPIDAAIEKLLRGVLTSRDKFIGCEDPVFASSTGRPVDAHNLFNRVLKPIGRKLGMPWLGWHVFRHPHASWVRQEAASPADQTAMLGHSDIRMTMMYGQQDLERRRAVVEKMGVKSIQGKSQGPGVTEWANINLRSWGLQVQVLPRLPR